MPQNSPYRPDTISAIKVYGKIAKKVSEPDGFSIFSSIIPDDQSLSFMT